MFLVLEGRLFVTVSVQKSRPGTDSADFIVLLDEGRFFNVQPYIEIQTVLYSSPILGDWKAGCKVQPSWEWEGQAVLSVLYSTAW